RATTRRSQWYALSHRAGPTQHPCGGSAAGAGPTAHRRLSPFLSDPCITMSDSIKHVTDASFEADVLQSELPVLVDYWAEWCGPCKMIAPILEEAAAKYQGRVIIAKVNVDENPDSAAKYGIRGIPTLM